MKKQTQKKQRALSNANPAIAAASITDTLTGNGTAKNKTTETTEKPITLNSEEIKARDKLEGIIRSSQESNADDFRRMIGAFYQIRERKLFRPYAKFSVYCKAELNYGRTPAYRFAEAGEIVHQSPNGDGMQPFTSDAHFRPLLALSVEDRAAVVSLVEMWHRTWGKDDVVSPALVQAAVKFLHPPDGPKPPSDEKLKMAAKFHAAVVEARENLPSNTPTEFRLVITNLEKKAKAFANPRRSSGIDWTDKTWNPLQGCSPVSKGCWKCYAAKLVATRLADVYPGLAKEKTGPDGKKEFVFTGIIKLLPHELAQPLADRTPSRYFVNSMSDVFHKNVPDNFIEAVFEVMEKCPWHQFQLLTKRPERMATFTQKRYATKEPPPHIWLGTSTEDQKNFDQRIQHLLKVRAAVRWLSCEPLLGPIKFKDLNQLDWVVAGGESGSDRKMDKKWAISIRDQCAEANVPFFFKQWGDFNEAGEKQRKAKKDGLTPPTLDGKIYDAYPAERVGSGDPEVPVKA